jgi:haloalkane dehalogenase
MTAYRRALPTAEARMPTYVFPREILGSRAFLAEVRDGLRVLSSKPALIVWGDRDIAFRASEREELERIFTRHKTVILRGAGHFIQEDAPDAIAEAVRGWWHEVE